MFTRCPGKLVHPLIAIPRMGCGASLVTLLVVAGKPGHDQLLMGEIGVSQRGLEPTRLHAAHNRGGSPTMEYGVSILVFPAGEAEILLAIHFGATFG